MSDSTDAAESGAWPARPTPSAADRSATPLRQSQVLVVDDDLAITELLCSYLARFGFVTHAADSPAAMRHQMSTQAIDLVVLDLSLPGTDGLVLTQEIRARSRVPIIILTARAQASDRIVGLEMGADDYMSKPFEPRELVARIHTVLRRVRGQPAPEMADSDTVHFDGWTLCRSERRLTSPAGVLVPLSNAEYLLLATFLKSAGRLCSRDQLMTQARGRTMDNVERGIDLLVSRLRQKLGDDPREPSLIKTVRGAGYLFDTRPVRGSLHWA